MKTIKGKMIGQTLVISLSILFITIVTASVTSIRFLQQKTLEGMVETTERYASDITTWYTSKEATIQHLATVAGEVFYAEQEALWDYTTARLKEETDFIDMYCGFESKIFLQGSRTGIAEGYDCTSRGWYQESKAAGEAICTAPYVDIVTEKMCVTFATPIYHEGVLVGVVGADVLIDDLVEMIQAISVGEGSYAFLIDQNGSFITHPEGDYLPTATATTHFIDAYTMLTQEQVSDLSTLVKVTDYDDVARTLSRVTIGANHWVLGIAIPADRALRQLLPLIILLGILAIGGCLLLILNTILLSNKINKPIRSLKQFAMGDFREIQDVIPQDRSVATPYKDEIEEITKATTTVRSHIRDIIKESKEQSEVLEHVIQTINNEMHCLNQEIEVIGASIMEINERAARTSKNVNKVNDEGCAIEESVNDVIKRVSHAASLAVTIEKRAEEMRLTSIHAYEEATHMYRVSQKEVSEAIQNAEKVRKIDALISAILSISDQTNMLALNASIESARVGEVGKGFKVVAEQIGGLATHTKELVQSIQGVIDEAYGAVQALTYQAEALLQFMDQRVIYDYQVSVEQANSYKEDAQFYAKMSHEIGKTAEVLALAMKSVDTEIEGIAQLSVGIATDTETVSSSTYGVGENATKIVEKIQLLEISMTHLKEVIDQFVI